MKKWFKVFVSLLILLGSGILIVPVKAYDEVRAIIYFHRNTSSEDDYVIQEEYVIREDIGRLRPVSFSYEGHVLVGYSDSKDSKEIIYKPMEYISYWLIQSTPEIHLYAIWEEIDPTYGGVIFIGDSYAGTSNWPTYTAENLGLKSFIESSLGGTGFVNVVNDPWGQVTNFETLLEHAIIIAGEENRKQYQWIIVEGGYNDQYYDYEKVHYGIESFIKRAKEAFPNARIVLGMNGYNVYNADVRYMLDKTTSYYKEYGKKYGGYYINGIDKIFHEEDANLFLEDGFHPNGEAGQKIAEVTSSQIKNIKNKISPLFWVGLFLLLLLIYLIYLFLHQNLLMNTRKKVNKRRVPVNRDFIG